MPCFGFCRPEDVVLPGGVQSKSYHNSTHYECLCPNHLLEWMMGEIGNLTVLIRHVVHASKAIKGQALTVCWEYGIESCENVWRTRKQVTVVFIMQAAFNDQVWQLYIDSASWTSPKGNPIAEVGFVLLSPQTYVLPHAFSLSKLFANNAVEYNALLICMKNAHELGIRKLEA